MLETTSIERIIKDSAGFARRGSGAKCEFRIADDLANVKADPGQISQVINNLVINADQAMPNGGTIRIAAENCTVKGESDLPLKPGGYVKISIADEGVGISIDHLSKIVDPFFTTKDTGNGLGLFSCYSIIRQHGGHISVRSQVDIGTVFRIYLPATTDQEPTVAGTGRTLSAGSGRVLVVDDEKPVRDIATAIVKSLEYEAVAVADGQTALVACRNAMKSERSFDVVIMDLTIPGGMGGKEALQHLRMLDPSVKAIVSSGYSTDPVMADPGAYGFRAKVAKPYRVEDLGMALSSVLGETTG